MKCQSLGFPLGDQARWPRPSARYETRRAGYETRRAGYETRRAGFWIDSITRPGRGGRFLVKNIFQFILYPVFV